LDGKCYGFTTPSVTCVEVIGGSTEDYAINVFFESRKEAFWFAADLVEFVDHAAGTEIRLDGVPKKWVRSSNGEWVEIEDSPNPLKPWWKVWK